MSDILLEGILKKALLICIIHLCLIGCSSSGPEITNITLSDETPFTGQTLILNVYSLTDNPPMTYTWECSGGRFDEWDDSQYWVYWTAPEDTGNQTVTCTVKDAEDDMEIFPFTITVQERIIDDTLVDGQVLSIHKQKTSTIGGIWASTEDGDIRYITSGTNETTTWEGALGSMHVELDSSASAFTLWGAEPEGIDIIMQTQGSNPTTLTCTTCEDSDTIYDLTIDVIDANLLWIGSDSGMHYYNSSTTTWGDYKPGEIGKTNDFFQGADFVYAATSTGIYELDPYAVDSDPVYTGDSCAVIEVVNDDETVTVWHITDSQVYRDGQLMDSQPDNVECSLDADRNNIVWCGKYWWDDIDEEWQSPPGFENIDIAESVVSFEGLVYLRTTSGTLLRW